MGKVSHQDIGQMQMYVNYYDREIKQEDENKTVGILLSTNKNETVVKTHCLKIIRQSFPQNINYICQQNRN